SNRVPRRLPGDDDARSRFAREPERSTVLDLVPRDVVLGLIGHWREPGVADRAHGQPAALHVVDVVVDRDHAAAPGLKDNARGIADAGRAVDLALDDFRS